MVKGYFDNDPVNVTGLAWNTSLGNDIDGVWEKLLSGESGFFEDPLGFPLRNNKVSKIKALDNLNDKDKFIYLTIETIKEAIKNASLNLDDMDGKRVRLVIGTSYGYNLDDDDSLRLDDWVSEVEKKFNFKDSIVLSTACSTGSDSVYIGAELIKNNQCDICICGATDIATLAKRLGHSSLGTMSPTSLKAFDEDHDGMLIGEGSGFIILESSKSSKKRNAKIYAYYRGAGASNDASGLTSPDPEGKSIFLAVNRALKSSGLNIEDICIINAHGSGTIINDKAERDGYQRIFKDSGNKPIVFATKGAFGHCLGATGIIEIIALIIALKEKIVPPICNLSKPMEGFVLKLPIKESLPFKGNIGISVTLGFGGFNTCIIMQGV